MSQKLSNYANASAGKREDNIFKVFAYLNTQKSEFLPSEVKNKVSVEDKTILSYLWAIAKAQTCERAFLERINAGEAVQWYLHNRNFSPREKDVAAKLYQELVVLLQTPEKQPGQFTFTLSEELRPVFYYRLEQSLLFYEKKS